MSNQELLEKAIVNLAIENAKLKNDVTKLKEDNDNFWKWYTQKRDLLEKVEKENEMLRAEKENCQP